MNISFENGQPFPNETHHHTRLTAARLREGIQASGLYVAGESIAIPSAKSIADILGLTTGAFFGKNSMPNGYVGLVEHATGLQAIQHSGLLLVSRETTVVPLPETDLPC